MQQYPLESADYADIDIRFKEFILLHFPDDATSAFTFTLVTSSSKKKTISSRTAWMDDVNKEDLGGHLKGKVTVNQDSITAPLTVEWR